MQRTVSTPPPLLFFFFPFRSSTAASVSVALALAASIVGCSKGPLEGSAGERRAARLPAIAAEAHDTADLRTPDVDYDAKDPAQDYVGRYVRATNRYGDDATCARLDPSKPKDGKRVVAVRGRASCGSADPHDTFVVDLAADRLALADGSNGGPLAAWPDGSAPGAEARPIQTLATARDWASPVADTLSELGLTPSRIELHGRGTYRIVSLAGWTEPVAKDASRESQHAVAKKLCAANGESLALFGGGAPHELARIRCPNGDTEWESLRALGASTK